MLVFAVSIFDIAFEQQKFILWTLIQIKLHCNFFSFDYFRLKFCVKVVEQIENHRGSIKESLKSGRCGLESYRNSVCL